MNDIQNAYFMNLLTSCFAFWKYDQFLQIQKYNWKKNAVLISNFTTHFDSQNIPFILSVHTYMSQDKQFLIISFYWFVITYFFLNLNFLVNCLCENIIFNILPVVGNCQKYWSRCIIACYYLAWSSLVVIMCRWFIACYI